MSPVAVPDQAEVDEHATAFRGPQVCALVGITYRQLDYWARTGLVVPSIADAKGSGTQRLYSADDVALAKVIRRLVDDDRRDQRASNSRLLMARTIAPQLRALLEAGAADDLVLVITRDGVIPVTNGDELLAAVQTHHVVTVLGGFGTTTDTETPATADATSSAA